MLFRSNPRRNTPRHILIKLTKTKHKDQILKAAREKQQITHKGIPISLRVFAISEIKNTLEATNSRITEAEDRISELEDRMVEINDSG